MHAKRNHITTLVLLVIATSCTDEPDSFSRFTADTDPQSVCDQFPMLAAPEPTEVREIAGTTVEVVQTEGVTNEDVNALASVIEQTNTLLSKSVRMPSKIRMVVCPIGLYYFRAYAQMDPPTLVTFAKVGAMVNNEIVVLPERALASTAHEYGHLILSAEFAANVTGYDTVLDFLRAKTRENQLHAELGDASVTSPLREELEEQLELTTENINILNSQLPSGFIARPAHEELFADLVAAAWAGKPDANSSPLKEIGFPESYYVHRDFSKDLSASDISANDHYALSIGVRHRLWSALTSGKSEAHTVVSALASALGADINELSQDPSFTPDTKESYSKRINLRLDMDSVFN